MPASVPVTFEVVALDAADDTQLIIGQAHFVKTVEDLHEALVGVHPGLRFGIGFCEASGDRLVRRSGNDQDLVDLAARLARSIGAGHSFVVVLREGYPLNALNQIKAVPEVCTVYAATANPVEVVVAVTEHGRGIAAVIDGQPPVGIETPTDATRRHALLRDLGYKL